MRDDYAVMKSKKARGAVLSNLADNYPTEISYDVLSRVMCTTGQCVPGEMRRVIAYLADKGYIGVTTPEEPTVNQYEGSMVSLRAHGIDLLEQSIPEDPGVVF